MLDVVSVLVGLLPLEVTPSAAPGVVHPAGGHGFAAYILGGFFALGLLMLAMFLISLKPKRVDPTPND